MKQFSPALLLQRAGKKLGLDHLNNREKGIVAGGIVFVLLFVVLQFVVTPFFDARSRLQSSIARKNDQLLDIKLMAQEYESMQEQTGDIQQMIRARKPGFTLFSFLDKKAESASVKKQIKYMKPSTVEGDGELIESQVKMKLEQVTLQQLVTFLQGVESKADVVTVPRISIQKSNKESGFLDAVMQITTFSVRE